MESPGVKSKLFTFVFLELSKAEQGRSGQGRAGQGELGRQPNQTAAAGHMFIIRFPGRQIDGETTERSAGVTGNLLSGGFGLSCRCLPPTMLQVRLIKSFALSVSLRPCPALG